MEEHPIPSVYDAAMPAEDVKLVNLCDTPQQFQVSYVTLDMSPVKL